jgi:transposase-like protein
MNLIEISNKIPTELQAIEYFEKIRFGKKVKCVYCYSEKLSNRNKDYRHNCKNCGKTTAVTVGTELHNTRLPLKTWLYAIAIITDAKKGVSAKQLERNLGVHYETAWTMYHKLRNLMIDENESIEDLEGIVEMDETYVGGKPRPFNDGTTTKPYNKTTVIPELDKRLKELKEAGIKLKRGRGNPAKSDIEPKRGRGTNKTPVVGIVQRDGNVVAQVMRTLTSKNLSDMLQKHVDEDDSVLITDEYSGYSKIDRIIEHVKIDHNRLYSYKGINTNSIESFWAIIKRQIIGQHHQVSVKYLPKYVAEAVFKYNNRNIDDMFETLVKKAIIPNNR